MIETWAARPNRSRLSRRDELLSVAADLFAERGFAKVTVDDIGNAAGVSGPALYHHFDGKESLLGEMLVRIRTRCSRGRSPSSTTSRSTRPSIP